MHTCTHPTHTHTCLLFSLPMFTFHIVSWVLGVANTVQTVANTSGTGNMQRHASDSRTRIHIALALVPFCHSVTLPYVHRDGRPLPFRVCCLLYHSCCVCLCMSVLPLCSVVRSALSLSCCCCRTYLPHSPGMLLIHSSSPRNHSRLLRFVRTLADKCCAMVDVSLSRSSSRESMRLMRAPCAPLLAASSCTNHSPCLLSAISLRCPHTPNWRTDGVCSASKANDWSILKRVT